MRFKFLSLPIISMILVSFLGVIVVAISIKPEKGFVPDENTAIRIAEAVLIPIYGEKDVIEHRPYKAILKDNSIWVITGTLNSSKGVLIVGGVPEVQLQKSDGKILNVIHGK